MVMTLKMRMAVVVQDDNHAHGSVVCTSKLILVLFTWLMLLTGFSDIETVFLYQQE